MAVLDEVVGALSSAWIARHPPIFAKARKTIHPPRDQLVDVGLVPDVPDDPVVGAVERPVQGDGQLDDPEIGAQVAAGTGYLIYQELADLLTEVSQLGIVQMSQIGGSPDSGEKRGHNDTD